jgi:hypothetical protein
MRAFVAAVLRDEPGPVEAGTDAPIELIKRGHLGPIAYRRGVSALRDEYAASMIVVERRARVLREVLDALVPAGVSVAPIKGIGFIGPGNIYPDAAQRPMNDMDLLIAPHTMPVAADAMNALGFRRVGLLRKLSSYYHAQVFQRGDMMVELHRHIVQRGRTSLHAEDLWRHARPAADLEGAHRLDRVDELLVCMLHIARHELAVPAINYVDVARLWRRLDAGERDLLAQRATRYRIARALTAVRAMTELLAAGVAGRPDIGLPSRVMPSTDDVLRGVRPRRVRQIGQKLALVQGPRELVGLGLAYVAAMADGLRLSKRLRPH